MERSRFFQTVLNRVGHAAAHRAPGIDLMDFRIVQLPQRSEQPGGEGIHIRLSAIGEGIAAIVQGQLFFKAQHPVSRLKVGADIGRRVFPGTGNNDHRLRGGVVAVFHAGSLDYRILVHLRGDSLVHHQVAQHRNQLLGANSAGAQ